jgi:hypothetical protein
LEVYLGDAGLMVRPISGEAELVAAGDAPAERPGTILYAF